MRTRAWGAVVALGLSFLLIGQSAVSAAPPRVVRIGELRLSEAKTAALRADWVDRILADYPVGSWAPLKMTLDDRDLALMGLPPRRVLLAHRYPVPTAFYPGGRMVRLGAASKARSGKGSGGSGSGGAGGPTAVTYAGAGFFGIRPGAWLLTVTSKAIGWCSMAHVYGQPGSYQISTAGHCGKAGDTGTVIGVLGNRSDVPVLLDFGKYAKSTGDAGIGRDWALISVSSQYQSLVSPTMAFWGGPFGIYTPTGDVIGASFPRQGLVPNVSVNPNPALVQQIVHYGHGAGAGTGGTPRSGTAITWRPTYYAFFGAITPGDSGSGSNTLAGARVGDERQAAGINTHLYVDSSLRTGLGVMAGTRATQVSATLANGQLLPYPAPLPGAP